MAQKDMSEKLLEEYDDVFADIVNVLLFNGKNLIKPEQLNKSNVVSQFKADDGELHEQERDVAKFWKKGGVYIALYGIENQTKIDKNMPLRVINYDGVSYRSQLLNNNSELKYPVVTLVLYFGEKRWSAPRSLLEAICVPDELKPYVNDYKINLYEISYLTDEQLKMFKSDFGILADFFVNKRRNENYLPKDERKFKHVDAMLKIFKAMALEQHYEMDFSDIKNGGYSMSGIFERVINMGISEGMEKGMKQGIEKGMEKGIETAHRETAIELLKAGTDENIILQACKLTKDQLEQLKKDMLMVQ